MLCEVITAVAAVEREEILVNSVKMNLQKIIEMEGLSIDELNETSITKETYLHIVQNDSAVKILYEAGVDVVGLVDYCE